MWSITDWGSIVTFLGLPESICGGYENGTFIDQTGKNAQIWTKLDRT
jgi:hypothetical protein